MSRRIAHATLFVLLCASCSRSLEIVGGDILDGGGGDPNGGPSTLFKGYDIRTLAVGGGLLFFGEETQTEDHLQVGTNSGDNERTFASFHTNNGSASSYGAIFQIGITGNWVVWLIDEVNNGESLNIYMQQVSGAGTPMRIAGPQAQGFVLDAATIYYSDGQRITAHPLDGSPEKVVAAPQLAKGAPVLSGTDLYWVEDSGVKKVSTSGGSVEQVVSAQWVSGIAVDSSQLYYFTQDNVIHAAPLGSSTFHNVVALGQNDPVFEMFADQSGIWVKQLSRLLLFPPGEITPIVKIDDGAVISAFTLDDTYLYWVQLGMHDATGTPCSIHRAGRSYKP